MKRAPAQSNSGGIALALSRKSSGDRPDVRKSLMLALVRRGDGQFEQPWKVCSPGQMSLFVEQLRTLSRSCAAAMALESTGTFWDMLRRQLSEAGRHFDDVRKLLNIMKRLVDLGNTEGVMHIALT